MTIPPKLLRILIEAKSYLITEKSLLSQNLVNLPNVTSFIFECNLVKWGNIVKFVKPLQTKIVIALY